MADAKRGLALLDAELGEKAPGVQGLIDEAERLASGDVPQHWPPALDLEALAEREPERPKFIMDDWLPCGYASLIAGHGGVGKSGIALHLAVCIAAGIPFFGVPVERRRVFYLSCEDRESILHWRLARICAHVGVNLASLRGWLEIVDLVGHDAVLWDRDPRTGYTITPAFAHLAERVREYETQLLVVDGISDTFAGNENARAEVKRFVNALVSLIPADSGAVLLVGHIAKPTASGAPTSEGYSGSTSWHNSVRARWYLYPETSRSDDSDRPERTGDLILELQKANLGRTDQTMRFRWDDTARMFLGESIGASAFDRKHQDREERAGILRAFKSCADSVPPIIVPIAMQGPRTAHQVLSLRPEFPTSLRASGSAQKRRFRRILEELRQSRAIEEIEYRRTNRHHAAQLRLTTEGMRQCVV